MPRLMFACFLLGGLIPEPTPTDYCATSFCAAGLTNVGCQPPPLTGGPACAGMDQVVIEIGQAEIAYILDLFNKLRSEYASGRHGPTFPSASRMPVLQWNAELAKQAGHNARSCNVRRDQCHNTAEFSNSGQGKEYLLLINVVNTNQIFFETIQSARIDATLISYTSYNSAADSFGILANLLNDRSSKVGCAIQKITLQNMPYYYVVCNFSDNLVDEEPLYTQGATGSGCSSVSTTYSGLCAA